MLSTCNRLCCLFPSQREGGGAERAVSQTVWSAVLFPKTLLCLSGVVLDISSEYHVERPDQARQGQSVVE